MEGDKKSVYLWWEDLCFGEGRRDSSGKYGPGKGVPVTR